MSWVYRILTMAVFGLLAFAIYASIQGWGLRSDAEAVAQGKGRARAGSVGGRGFYGGGPRYGK